MLRDAEDGITLSRAQRDLGISRLGATLGTGMSCLASILFVWMGTTFNFLTAFESIIGPTFCVASFLLTAAFIVVREDRLIRVAAILKVFIGFVTIAGLVEGAINPDSNLEYYLIWVPVYYTAIVFGARTKRERRWSILYFCICSIVTLIALVLGPLGWEDDHVPLLLSGIAGQFALLVVFSELASTFETHAAAAARMGAAEENARVLQYAAQASEESDRAKRAFIANVSHELRTPLNAIIGFSQIMKWRGDKAPNEEKRLEYAATIETSAHLMLDLINDFLDLSKIEAGKMELHDETVSVRSIFEDMITLVAASANNRSIIIKLKIARALPQLRADKRILSQMVLNLLTNAVKYTDVGDTVTLGAGLDQQGSVQVYVADNGPGMDAATLARMLRPFEQDRNIYTTGQGGSGLGLPLVKSLAELHEAKFTLDSTPGRGTRATITFPLDRVVRH